MNKDFKVLLISGHGAGDTGANGCGYQEYKLTRELVNLVAPRLRNYCTVDVYDQNRNAFQDVQNGTFKIGRYNYVLEVHFNACVNDQIGNGVTTGTEIYVTGSEKGITVEQAIVNNVAACGLKKRGVKRMNFLVIQTVKNMGMSSALIETCFIDDKDDMNVYQAKKNQVADGIVKGIVDEFGLGDAQSTKPDKPSQPSGGHSFKYAIGQKVRFSTCYISSTNAANRISPISAANMARDNGTITNQYNINGVSAYLLDNGLCFINDGDIREVINGSSPQSTMSARQFALEVWIQGLHGNGETRKAECKKYGVDYNEVQRLLGILANGGGI